jgi:hypothetical protein
MFGSPDYGMLKDIKDIKELLGRLQTPLGSFLNGGSQSPGNSDPCGQGEQTSTSSLGNGSDKNRLRPHTGRGDDKKNDSGFGLPNDRSSWAEDGGAGPPTGSGWTRIHDDGHGNYQYFNRSTGEERLGIASRNPDGGGSGTAYRGWTDEHGHQRTERVDRTEDPDGHRTQTVTETLTSTSGNQRTTTTQTTTNEIDSHGNRTVTRSERHQYTSTFLPDGDHPETVRSEPKRSRGDSLPTDDGRIRQHVPKNWSPLQGARNYVPPPSRPGKPRINPGPSSDGTFPSGSNWPGTGANGQNTLPSPCGPQGTSAPPANRTDGGATSPTPMVINPDPDHLGGRIGSGGSRIRNRGQEEGGTRGGPDGPGGTPWVSQ